MAQPSPKRSTDHESSEIATASVHAGVHASLEMLGDNADMRGAVLRDSSNVHLIDLDSNVRHILTVLRDNATSRGDLVFFVHRLARLLVEEGLNFVSTKPKIVTTPCNEQFQGVEFSHSICGITIVRAGMQE